MDLKIKGIVLKSLDSGEKDKIITVFSLEKGILRAKLKGVKNSGSKLKFAKEIFCFADFTLTEKNGFFTIISADCIDSFFNITKKYSAFLEAGRIFKIILTVSNEGEENGFLFLECLKALKTLTYENVCENVVLIKFLISLFFNQGYEFFCEKCTNCKNNLNESRWFNFDTGEVLCASCKNGFSERISFPVNNIFKIIKQTEYERLSTIKPNKEITEQALCLLEKNFERRFVTA